eukprot:TRINITY_DN15892_c0_g1_i1.p1 TRINITY_DN15892_c0_g1~~TRINITY_DN15892_c0_g1_i1.p1  ORF type:complete len:407 (+),score=58.69 TRINITY_DN15892_c0_g1_i1:177-1223(+)
MASAKVDALFVEEIEVGLQLRAAPEVPNYMPIILLYRSADRGIACLLASANITVSVLSTDWIEQAKTWPPCKSPLRLHLMVDSGLGREGVRPDEVISATVAVLNQWPHWSLDGMYTHWCCPYDVQEMAKSQDIFDVALRSVNGVRAKFIKTAAQGLFTVHSSSSSRALHGPHHDLLRVGGLLFGDPVQLSDPEGNRFTLPGPHRTLLWKSRIGSLRWCLPGERFSLCVEAHSCETGPRHRYQMLLGLIPVGGEDFSDSVVMSGPYREKLPLIEKSPDGILVQIPIDSRTFHDVYEGMEVLLCGEQCVQGLFNVPAHVPRILVKDPSIEMTYFCPQETIFQKAKVGEKS